MKTRITTYLIGAGILLTVLGLGACAGSSVTETYPQAYRSALLDAHTAGVPGQPMPDATIDRFVALMTGLRDNPNWERDVRAVYADKIHFSDTLVIARTQDEIVAHFRGLHGTQAEIEVIIEEVIHSEHATYLRWSMINRYEVFGSPVVSDTIGISMMRADADGRIVFHQDFWDSAEGFYQHMPVLGSVIRAVQRRFEVTQQ